MVVMETEDILKVLPHRYPMLLVDRIIECDFKERIVGIKNLTINEAFFSGHFPGHPVMPGVLQLEAMAQVGGILTNKMFDRAGKVAYFISIDKARFRRVIRPGDQMRIEVKLHRVKMNISVMTGTVYVDGEIASEAELKFAGVDE